VSLWCRLHCGSPSRLISFPDPAKFPAHQEEGIRSHQPADPQQGGSRHGDVVGHDKPADCLTSLMHNEEDRMAEPIQPKLTLTMNRRQLLATVAAIPTSGIVPKVNAADAVEAVVTASIPTSEPSPLNVCAATARRIEQIVARNRIREEACLPLLSIPKELRRMKMVADVEAFEAFADNHRDAVWDEMLATKGQGRGEPNWRPSGWIRQRFEVARRG